MKKKIALVLGCTGQDGSYCAELLLSKKYRVYGLIRKTATDNTINIKHILANKNFTLVKGDLVDSHSINTLIHKIKPNEIYNYADQDHVGWSSIVPEYSFLVTVISNLKIFEFIKENKLPIKYFVPLSSNIFGSSKTKKQNEKSLLNPTSIYGIAKTSLYHVCNYYRSTYNLKIYNSIFYNHESPRRSEEYVTKKIVKKACSIKINNDKKLELGDINIKIDWGYAKDYVEAAWQIMQLKDPDIFIISSGKLTSVKNFCKLVFDYLKLDYKKYLKINKKFIRPSKTSNLFGDFSKAGRVFNYKPKTDIKKLVKIMVDDELQKYNR
jgi:GDPmannose 4,6-dehydratase